MRCFFGYTASGLIWSVETWRGGFPGHCDLSDAGSTHPIAVGLLAHRSENDPLIVGFLPYDCDCASSDDDGMCACPAETRDASYVDVVQRVLVAKPDVRLYLDGVLQPVDAQVTRAPGAVVMMQLRGAVPNGQTVELRGSRIHADFPTPVTVSFAAGVTNDVTLVAPAQGMDGSLFVWGKWSQKLRLRLKGFSA